MFSACDVPAADLMNALLRLARQGIPLSSSRALASVSGGSGAINPYSVGPYQVFDRNAKRIQKERAALLDGGHRSRTVDYLRDEVADRMIERLMVCFNAYYLNLCANNLSIVGHQTNIQFCT